MYKYTRFHLDMFLFCFDGYLLSRCHVYYDDGYLYMIYTSVVSDEIMSSRRFFVTNGNIDRISSLTSQHKYEGNIQPSTLYSFDDTIYDLDSFLRKYATYHLDKIIFGKI